MGAAWYSFRVLGFGKTQFPSLLGHRFWQSSITSAKAESSGSSSWLYSVFTSLTRPWTTPRTTCKVKFTKSKSDHLRARTSLTRKPRHMAPWLHGQDEGLLSALAA